MKVITTRRQVSDTSMLRYSADHQGERKYTTMQHDESPEEDRHRMAAQALIKKLHWSPGLLLGGPIKEGYAWLYLPLSALDTATIDRLKAIE